MKWMHQRYLKSKEFNAIKWKMYTTDSWYRAVCIRCPDRPSSWSSTNEHQFRSVRGFNQHPNSSQEM
jgi:hypothetical protein